MSEVYVFCEKCEGNITLTVTDDDMTRMTGGLLTCVSIHGSPQHAIMVYLDRQLRVRGVEYPLTVQFDKSEQSADSESLDSMMTEMEDKLELGLSSLVEFFARKPKDAIRTFAKVIAQLMANHDVYLIHDDKSIADIVTTSIQNLFANQRVPLYSFTHEISDDLQDYDKFVFDIQKTEIVSDGKKVEDKYIEQIIKECLDETNGFFRLKNELSKIFFSFSKIKQLLSTRDEPYLETKLAADASIDIALLPNLLKMAENEGIDVKSKVKKDALGRAIRSF